MTNKLENENISDDIKDIDYNTERIADSLEKMHIQLNMKKSEK